MIRGYVVCEGQTEETFIRDVIAPILANQQIYLTARLIPTSKNNKGGALTYERVKRFIINSLKEDDVFITTFFDLYALDNTFPNFSASKQQTDIYKKVASFEQAFKDDIVKENSSFAPHFFPYIQPYEFEGLLFTDIAKLTEIETTWATATNNLQVMRDNAETPEHINNGYETKPSARLEKCLTNPKYRKTLHGTLAIEAIGIDKLLAECRHFAEWYNQLLALPPVQS
ncbi:MAG: DUF4276 family protein [Methylococcales bacterium]|nr:DUF4276 family protein [Methylococcales bacterium]MDP3837427.1 DUF4276 family protein [Methylococcales bacterium]